MASGTTSTETAKEGQPKLEAALADAVGAI
jgi:hypothetical protein